MHTHGSVSTFGKPLVTNIPFLHIQMGHLSNNSAGTLDDVKKIWVDLFSGYKINRAVGRELNLPISSCSLKSVVLTV